MAASTLSIAPSSSSSFALQKRQSDTSIAQFHSTSIYPIATIKPFKPLKLISPKITRALHLSIRLPLHLCHCTAAFDDAAQSAIDESDEDPEVEIEETEGEDEGAEQEEEDGEKKETDSPDACRLYVGNLPYTTNSAQLAEIFGECGQVRSVEIIYDRVTDRSRGFAFVTMGTVEEGKEAIRMFDGTQIGGRAVRVNFPEVPRGGERRVMGAKVRSTNQSFVETPHKIYAGNLSWNITSQGLRDTFADQPGFLSAKVIFERETGRSRGFGFVSFGSAEEAEAALNSMNGSEVEGRPLRLNMAAERARPAPSDAIESSLEDSVEQNEVFSSIGN